MTPQQLALMVPIIGSIGLFTMIIFIRRFENIERMAMIERGLNPKDTKRFLGRRDPYRPLRFGFTAVGIGLGLFFGNLFFHDEGVIAGLIVLCGGVGLLSGYLLQMGLQSKANKDDKDKTESDEYL